jgi:hypothetical protein
MISQRDLELLNAYLDGELDAPARAALEARLAAEPALRRELESLRVVIGLVRGLPRLTAPRSFALSPEQARPPRSLRLQRALPILSAAAAIAIIIFGAILLTRPTPPPAQETTGAAVVLVSTATPAPTQLLPGAIAPVSVSGTQPPLPTQPLIVQSARALPTPTVMIDVMAAMPMAADAIPETAAVGMMDASGASESQAEAFAVPAAPENASVSPLQTLVDALLSLLRALLVLLSAR